jgi:hypothetical protein
VRGQDKNWKKKRLMLPRESPFRPEPALDDPPRAGDKGILCQEIAKDLLTEALKVSTIGQIKTRFF